VDVALLPDENEEHLLLHRMVDGERRGEQLYVCIEESMRTAIPDTQLRPSQQHSVQPWGQVDLLDALRQLAEAQGLSLEACAKRYATASLPDGVRGWLWHEALGFTKA
jgi:CRISPR-associated endonuclease/helicase Cas3